MLELSVITPSTVFAEKPTNNPPDCRVLVVEEPIVLPELLDVFRKYR